MGKRIKVVGKSMPNRFAEMVMCISRGAVKWYVEEISELKHFGLCLCRNYTGRSEKRLMDGIEVENGAV